MARCIDRWCQGRALRRWVIIDAKMIELLVARIKPAHGFSQFFHVGLLLALPLTILVLVRIGGGFVQLALSLVQKL